MSWLIWLQRNIGRDLDKSVPISIRPHVRELTDAVDGPRRRHLLDHGAVVLMPLPRNAVMGPLRELSMTPLVQSNPITQHQPPRVYGYLRWKDSERASMKGGRLYIAREPVSYPGVDQVGKDEKADRLLRGSDARTRF